MKASLAIVGNGPSAAGKGTLIDAHDHVLRMNEWTTRNAPDSGKRVTIVQGYGKRTPIPSLEKNPGLEIWVNVAGRGALDLQYIVDNAAWRPIRVIPWTLQRTVDSAIMKESCSGTCGGTAGFKAFAMAIEDGRFGVIDLYGFDAVSSKAADVIGGDGVASVEDLPMHDYAAEKRLIHRCITEREWITDAVLPEMNWICRPEGIEL